jgi:PIN domain nuclease of toxin-antitoxin system
MKLLLDTHAFLWFVAGDERLSRRARQQLAATGAQPVLSVASVWEMAIKAGLKRLALPLPVDRFIAEKVADGLQILEIEWQHAAAVADLPWHHNDPFDRLLIAQALYEHLPVISADPFFPKYGVDLIW